MLSISVRNQTKMYEISIGCTWHRGCYSWSCVIAILADWRYHGYRSLEQSIPDSICSQRRRHPASPHTAIWWWWGCRGWVTWYKHCTEVGNTKQNGAWPRRVLLRELPSTGGLSHQTVMETPQELQDLYSSTSSDDQSSINSVVRVGGPVDESDSDQSAPPTPKRLRPNGEIGCNLQQDDSTSDESELDEEALVRAEEERQRNEDTSSTSSEETQMWVPSFCTFYVFTLDNMGIENYCYECRQSCQPAGSGSEWMTVITPAFFIAGDINSRCQNRQLGIASFSGLYWKR